MTAQPKPTAADVLREHADCRWNGFQRPASRMTCGAPIPGPGDDFTAQHQAEMLAAAGLLATAEHDAQVAAQASKAADEALVQIAAATDRQIVGDDVWQHSTLELAQNAGAVIEAVNDALLDYRDGWAIDEAERRADRIAGGAT